MTIANAYDARQLAKNSDDPKLKLERTLSVIEQWASAGKYSGTLADPMSDKLVNNLKARGFTVNQETNYISW